jgi:hypothetical protein
MVGVPLNEAEEDKEEKKGTSSLAMQWRWEIASCCAPSGQSVR